MRDGSLRYYFVSFIPLILFVLSQKVSDWQGQEESLFIFIQRLQVH
jgi:hypothetical protein